MINKDLSKLKMVALTERGYPNVTWYSPVKQNNKDDDFIISGMLRRFENHKNYKNTRVIQFYAMKTNELISEFKYEN